MSIHEHTCSHCAARVARREVQGIAWPHPCSAASREAHTSAELLIRQHTSAYVIISQHTSACVSVRRHTSANVSIRKNTSAYDVRQHTSAYVSIRQHTTYVSIRRHTSAYVTILAARLAERRTRALRLTETEVDYNLVCKLAYT